MNRIFVACAFMFLAFTSLKATHNIAGEITFTCVSGNQYEILVTTYTNYPSMVDRWELTVHFGDGDSAVVPRSNGVLFNGPNGEGEGEVLSNYGAKKNEYRVLHTYNPGASVKTFGARSPIWKFPNWEHAKIHLFGWVYHLSIRLDFVVKTDVFRLPLEYRQATHE